MSLRIESTYTPKVRVKIPNTPTIKESVKYWDNFNVNLLISIIKFKERL